jgi:RND family efflux transporter MFP subunit
MAGTIFQKGFSAATIAILFVSTEACRQKAPREVEPLPVHTAMVKTIGIGNAAKYSASIVPYTQVDLSFQSSGYIDHVRQVRSSNGGMRNIDQGDWVKRGTILATVSQQSYKDKLDQAQAQLSRSHAEYEKAKLSFDRVSALYGTQSATKPDYDSAKAQLDSTSASVSGAEAQISEAKIALGYCSLQAPFDGWIVKRTVDVGSFVGPTTNGFTIADTRTVKAVFGLPDTAIGDIRLGQHLSITTDALPHPFSGRVTSISPAADPKSRVFSVEVTIDNPRDQLKSGMIASLAINGSQLSQPVLAVPLSAVVRDPQRAQGFAVLVANGNSEIEQVRLKPVEMGSVYGNLIGVESGLQSGERVITTGSTLIRDGDRVRIVP